MIGWMPLDHTGNTISIFTMAEWIFRDEFSEFAIIGVYPRCFLASSLPALYAFLNCLIIMKTKAVRMAAD